MRREHRELIYRLTGAVVTCCLFAGFARAEVRSFSKIADLGTPIPDGTGNFTSLGQPEVNQADIVFGGVGNGSQAGIYRYDPATGALSTVVNTNTVLPGSASLNFGIPALAVYGPDISFIAFTTTGGNGLYTTRGGVRKVADSSNVPNDFPPTAPISMDAQGFAFTDSYVTQPFSLSFAGFATATDAGVVSLSIPVLPVLHYITRNGFVRFSSNQKFNGTTGSYTLTAPGVGIFSDGGGIPSLQQRGLLLPGQTAGFVFANVSAGDKGPLFSVDDQGNGVFRAQAVDEALNPLFSGLYVQRVGGQMQPVVDSNTIIPTFDGTTKFGAYKNVAIDGSVIAFIGGPASGPEGIFAASDGSLAEVVSVGDTLDGKTITGLTFSSDRPLSGSDLVFTATFGDGSSGLFLAEVPEPATAVLLLLGAIPLLTRRRAMR
jgi:hypothetical protein